MLTDVIVKEIQGLIREVVRFNAPVDKLISNFFRAHKRLNNHLRYIIAETVYSLLRNYYKLLSVVDDLGSYDGIGFLWCRILKLDSQLYQNIKLINFDRVKLIEFNPERKVLELPEWIVVKLKNQFADTEIAKLDEAFLSQAPLNLRVNTLKTSVDQVIKILGDEGVSLVRTKYSPYGLKLTDKIFLGKHQLFEKGHIEVQDEASQIAGLLLAPKRGDMVVDFCAGAGGKTLLFGMLMHNTGRIYAFDVNERRLNNLAPRLAKSGLSNVYPQLIASENDTKIKRLHGKIDKVFVDAPCSGLGTLRRNPELKFRQTDRSIKELQQKQLSILTSASKLLKVGGYLVYATCSILRDENQEVVEAFLAQNPNFILINACNSLNLDGLSSPDDYLSLLPHIHEADGFFASLLQRTPL